MAYRPNIPLVHDDHRLTTVAQFIQARSLVGQNGQPLDAEALLDYKDPASGRTNREQLRRTYSADELASGQFTGKEAQHLRVGALLYVPAWAFHKEFISTEGTGVYGQDDYQQLLSTYLTPLTERPEYRLPAAAHVDVQQISCQVWAWCKALGSDEPPAPGQSQLEGQLVALGPFLLSCTTQVGRQGGNFSLSLAPVVVAPGTTDLLAALRAAVSVWFEPGTTTPNFTHQGLLLNADPVEGRPEEARFLFHELLQANDLLFIRFDTHGEARQLLGVEPDVAQLGVDSDGHPRLFDMIGLVDSCRLSTSPEAQVSISVSGRDLMKVLLDDGDYFPPSQYAGIDVSGMFKNQLDPLLPGHRAARRLDSRLNALQAFVDQPVADVFKFIFAQLSHIALAPDALFTSWGARRTKYYYPDDAGGLTQDGRAKRVLEGYGAGIWQLISTIVDETARPRKLVDASLATAQGSLLSYVQKVAQAPFLEFFGDTYGDRYFFVCRRPPHNREDLRQLLALSDELPGFHLTPERIKETELGFSDQTAYSWYTLEPRGNFFGSQSQLRLAYLPSIFFPEFAELWGNKHNQVVTNYINYDGLVSTHQTPKVADLEAQGALDLKWLVETTAPLPFTRSGSVTSQFDRRKKFGMAIRHLGTREVYLIEAVTQSWALNDGVPQASTTTQLTRGMVDDDDAQGNSILDRYFELVDFNAAPHAPPDHAHGAGEATSSTARLNLYFDPGLPFPLREPETEYSAVAYDLNATGGNFYSAAQRSNRTQASQAQLEQLATELARDQGLTVRLLVYDADQALARRRAAYLRAWLADRAGALHYLSPADKDRGRRKMLARIEASGRPAHPTLTPADERAPVVTATRTHAQTAPPARNVGSQQNWRVNRHNLRFFLLRRQFHGR